MEKTPFKLGAQNSGAAKFGAYTGEVSPALIKEIGCEWVILGHSERRHLFKEEDHLILSRLRAALEEGLGVILCVGEVLQDRKQGKTFKVIEGQLSILKQNHVPANALKKLIVAYEPVWAIGTGENATPSQVQEVHAYIRNWFAEKCSATDAPGLRILYGGSVKPDNSSQIMGQKDVDGLLVGTSSLDPTVFAGVIKNGVKSRV
jgi:triosephosphate isomerase